MNELNVTKELIKKAVEGINVGVEVSNMIIEDPELYGYEPDYKYAAAYGNLTGTIIMVKKLLEVLADA